MLICLEILYRCMAESKSYKVYGAERVLRIVLPAAEARQAGIKAGDSVTWELRDGSLLLRKAR